MSRPTWLYHHLPLNSLNEFTGLILYIEWLNSEILFTIIAFYPLSLFLKPRSNRHEFSLSRIIDRQQQRFIALECYSITSTAGIQALLNGIIKGYRPFELLGIIIVSGSVKWSNVRRSESEGSIFLTKRSREWSKPVCLTVFMCAS